MKKIAEEFKDLLEEESFVETDAENGEGEASGETFRIYKDRSYLGLKILEDLNAKRDGVYHKGGHDYQGFYLNDRSKEVGLMSQLYGATGLFALVNRYNVMSAIDNNSKKAFALRTSIKSAVLDVLDYVENNGYDLNPYIDEQTNAHLFHNENRANQYIGAMTWALSLFVSTVKAMRTGTIDFRKLISESSVAEANRELAELKGRLYFQIKQIITFFLENVIDDENGFGWGYANDCVEPSLFFTYSVIEAYSDFEDNVVIDRDDELLDYLNAGISNEEDHLEIRYRNLCYRIGDKTWNAYKDYLKTSFFSDKFDGNVVPVTPSEIRNTSRSSVLFNTIYVIFILLYSYTNIREKRYDEEGATRSEAERQTIVNAVTRGLQLVQNFYDDLKTEGNESIVDKHIISFNQHNRRTPEFSKMLNEESIQASSLLPMLVKANNLVALWILKFPQQSMTELFDEALSVKMEGKWLWENRKFDLLSTERYLEAIADYFDYYDEHEKNYAAKRFDNKTVREEERAKLKKQYDKQYEKRMEEELKRRAEAEAIRREEDRRAIRAEIEGSIRGEYIIEPQIEKKIGEILAAKSEEMMRNYLIGGLERIAAGGATGEFDRALSDAVDAYIRSKFAAKMTAIADDREIKLPKFEGKIAEDIADFIKNYFEFIADNSNQRVPKRLSDLVFGHEEK